MSKSILIFADTQFPAPSRASLEGVQQLADSAALVQAGQLAEKLDALNEGVFVNLHAPYFPKAAWGSIISFLKRGGGLISVGGAPFRIPVERTDSGWKAGNEQTAYHQELHIHEVLPVDSAPVASLSANADLPLLQGAEALLDIESTWNMVPHVSKSSELPHQMGSAGPMDAHLYPLLRGVSQDGRFVAAPVVLWENTKGKFQGGRWLFVNQTIGERFWQNGGAKQLLAWAQYCAASVTEFWLKPNYASYEPGERATLTLQHQWLGQDGGQAGNRGASATGAAVSHPASDAVYAAPTNDSVGDSQAAPSVLTASVQASSAAAASASGQLWSVSLTVDFVKSDALSALNNVPGQGEAAGQPEAVRLWEHQEKVTSSSRLSFKHITLPFDIQAGYYEVVCRAEAAAGEVRVLRQGFWGMDRAFLEQGEPVTCDRDYFQKDGRPLPVVGMTYMTSDVARKFLFLPNASVWSRDMAQMSNAGINWIRTGIWTAYRNIMQTDGHASEDALRAIDAFLLTAKSYNLQVTFTFFSFTPETWEGVNPYLDPRSVEAQKRFIGAIVSRHRDTSNVDWDLINEPSMFDPVRIFSDGPRTCGDVYEREAYSAWLRQRHGTIEALQERWNMTPVQLPSFEAAAPPEAEKINFDVQDMHQGKKGLQWLDYVLFSMDMHNRWASELYAAIKEECPNHMVTVGQDEALGAQRPSPFFYGEAVDYTTVHSWWLNDQLLWDGIFAKTADKPNLVQETGIMYVETPDGRAKRTEQELHNILERKYAYAFAAGGAGAVQWIWNTNFYMDNANESHIGALRADGTEKPEANVSYRFGAFMADIRDLFRNRKLEDIAVVFPYSNDFSNRKLAFEATTAATRTLAYELKRNFRGVGEYQLEELEQNPAKLILLPSPHNIEAEALNKLLDLVSRSGATLLLTGPAGLNAYWHPQNTLNGLLGERLPGNVRREEQLKLNGEVYAASFGMRKIAQLAKEVPACGQNGPNEVVTAAHGVGKLIWCPLPLELNDRGEALSALYRYAIEQSGCEEELQWLEGGSLPGVYGRKLSFDDGALFVFVSEFGQDADISVNDNATGKTYSFKLEEERSVLFAVNSNGDLLSVYRPLEVHIQTT
ncbi:beta-galactosidase [Paenibacillus oryzae]|uniref:beta-galactosidase n=1 Tax=Paenibacillus oryzae TaxID=1844972 RepID=UPI000A9F4919|nr:beta-galactosidase [Paenibacillus oryzae]